MIVGLAATVLLLFAVTPSLGACSLGPDEVETSGAARVNLTVSGYIRADYQFDR